MKPRERLTRRVTYRPGTIVVAAMVLPTLSSTTGAVPVNDAVPDPSQGTQLERLKALVQSGGH